MIQESILFFPEEKPQVTKIQGKYQPSVKSNLLWHSGRAIGGIHYALFFVDHHSRQKIIIGLKDLNKKTLQQAIKTFIQKIGFYPDELIADGDFKHK